MNHVQKCIEKFNHRVWITSLLSFFPELLVLEHYFLSDKAPENSTAKKVFGGFVAALAILPTLAITLPIGIVGLIIQAIIFPIQLLDAKIRDVRGKAKIEEVGQEDRYVYSQPNDLSGDGDEDGAHYVARNRKGYGNRLFSPADEKDDSEETPQNSAYSAP